MSDNFYQYADYNTLPDDQKVIWWFDEYICYDLVFYSIFGEVLVLVQRYTLYDYAWSDDYSGKLFNLCRNTNFAWYSPSITTEATIKVEAIQDKQQVIVTYLTYGYKKSIEDYLNGGDSNMHLQQEFRIFTAKDNGSTIPVSIAKYSAVITGQGVTLEPEALYKNFEQWADDIPLTIYHQGVDILPKLNRIRYGFLIYAKPPFTLFNGLYNSKITTKMGSSDGFSYDKAYKLLREIPYLPYHPNDMEYETVNNITEGLTNNMSLEDYEFLGESYTYGQADAKFKQLLAQTALIYPSTSNWEKIPDTNDDGEFLDIDGNVTTNPEEYFYIDNPDYIEEYVMGLELMIQEIHACLGAGEFAYYMDGGNPQPYRMNMARLLQQFARAYGVAYKPDGSIISVRGRVNVPYTGGTATIPDGYARGQFADRVNDAGDEVNGIAYQNRCNRYENLDDNNSGNDVLLNGDIILCENFLQLFESFLEDLDKGLNWQEMGSGLLPNADGTSYTTFEGMGTLLAEMAYTLSALSNNIQQTHVLALKNNAVIMEVLKGLGLPVGVGTLPLSVGGGNGAGGDNTATLTFPQLSANSVSLHKRIMDVLATLSVVTGGVVKTEEGGTP